MKMLQLLGDFVPQTPTGAPPLDPAGDFRRPDPLTNLFPLYPPNPCGLATPLSQCDVESDTSRVMRAVVHTGDTRAGLYSYARILTRF